MQEVNIAVNQMDQATQQNAAMAEEATAAGHSLAREAAKLAELVNRFQLSRSGSDSAVRSELERVAPHVFSPPKAPPHSQIRTQAPKAPARAPRAMARKVANGAPQATQSGGWDEF